MDSLEFKDGPLVWIDCEMTGLDPESDRIIEIAVLITNGNLDLVDEVGCHYVVRTEKQVLDNMGEWCVNQHGKSGLTQEAIDSPHSPAEVAAHVLAYIQRWIPEQRTGVLAGNSVHADAMFLRAKGPDSADLTKGIWSDIMEHLHYRIVDVSTIKELCWRWYPDVARLYKEQALKESAHRALDDIRGSIAELKFYRDSIFV
ncbi:putative RNA exonuclease Rex2 [Rhizoctonia solani 123E]|uniref:Putative RNA exonuclease Rex2 n=1 Tax=Rhizoctonia solani 123E TaxID=1423351 RepID=A0A074S0C8_9AGAM|nr:putative RNA exonuclease Rex2 [Rhizoctonia solani 123E]